MTHSSPNHMIREGVYAASDHWGEAGRPLSRHAALKAFAGPMVYAARIGDVIKIGHTQSLAGRVRTLATYNGEAVELLAFRPGTLDDEADIHATLRPFVARGHEYYTPTREVLAVVNVMRDEWNLSHVAA